MHIYSTCHTHVLPVIPQIETVKYLIQYKNGLTLPLVGANAAVAAAVVTGGSTLFLDISHTFGRTHWAHRRKRHPLQHLPAFQVLEHPPSPISELNVDRVFSQPAETLRRPKDL